MNANDLRIRLKKFALRLVPLCEVLPKKKISQIIEDQLLRFGFSAAANCRAACNAPSKKSFNAKLSIALEEIDEAAFWLEIIEEPELVKPTQLSLILAESIKLTKNLGASRRTVTKNLKLTIKN
jgi:four helix bundle protein